VSQLPPHIFKKQYRGFLSDVMYCILFARLFFFSKTFVVQNGSQKRKELQSVKISKLNT
jgi:hypothetical protein